MRGEPCHSGTAAVTCAKGVIDEDGSITRCIAGELLDERFVVALLASVEACVLKQQRLQTRYVEARSWCYSS